MSTDLLGNPQENTGRVKYNAKLVESFCATFDGTDKLTFSDLSGITIASSDGTSTPSINGNDIEFIAGTCWNLVLSNGSTYPLSEGNGTKVYDISGNNLHGSITSLDIDAFWDTTTQNTYHYNILNGFEYYDDDATGTDIIRVPYKIDGTKITPTITGYTKVSDNDAGNYHNNAETKLQQYQAPELINADRIDGNDFYFDSTSNNDTKSVEYSDIVANVGDNDQIFADITVTNKKENLLLYDGSLTGRDLENVKDYVNIT